jgi:hypothetical protein
MPRNTPLFTLAMAPFSALALALAAGPGSAATEVCGTFSLATEWTVKESPYLVTGDIFIPANSRLRIGPGVVVRFAKPKPCASDKAPVPEGSGEPHGRGSHDAHGSRGSHDSHGAKHSHGKPDAHGSHASHDDHGKASPGGHGSHGKADDAHAAPEPATAGIPQVDWADSTYTGIKAEGTFYVLGTEEQPVLFEAHDAKPGAVGWDGLRLTGQQAGAAEISFAVFRGANQAITADRSGFIIHHTLFEGNNTGVWAGLRGDVSIVNCNFIDNLSAGIVIRKGGPRIANNIFSGNRSYGIWSDGRPALQAWNNAFWRNREEPCFKCPYTMLAPVKTNANKDTTDKSGNMAADPVFMGSASHKAAMEADVATDTPAHLVKDPQLAKLEAEARAKEEKAAKSKKKNRKEFVPQGKGPYVLSRYSKLVNAGHPGRDFRDRDGSANDIGMHGGPMGRIVSDPF